MSSLTSLGYTATQYALLSGVYALSRSLLAAPAGLLAQWVGWLWPFAALAWLLYGVTARDGSHERSLGGNPETTIDR